MRNPIQSTLIFFALIFSITLVSQDKETAVDKSQSPYFMVQSKDASLDRMPLKSTSAEVNIVGVIADVTIHQTYKNEGKNALEAIYTFPASTRAAVYAMEMTIGDRTIKAKIEEKQKAREDYEQAKEEGKRASLLEQDRPNVFTMNVANIMPGDEVMVTLKYTEYLEPNKGVYQLVYPTVVGPRYSGESKQTDNEYNHTPYQKEGEEPFHNFDIKVNLSAGMPIQDITCNTHDIVVDFPILDQATIRLGEGETKGGNRDFVLEYKLSGEQINTGMLLYEHDDEKFFMMMIQPPKKVAVEEIPPREYIFINDVSGSMSGYPMDVSKKIMRNLVGNLRPEDRFNVLVFAGTSGWLAETSLPASNENIERAVNFIDNQQGGGGTAIIHALNKAMTFPRQEESLSRSYIVVTDGYVSVEKEVFDLIRNNNDKANTFVFGIGSSVNRYLLEGMAHVGQGEPFIVLDNNDANGKAEAFREYISSPVLTQIKVKFSDFDVYDVEPLSIPDVFAEKPIIIYGKYRGAASGSAKLTGFSGRKRWKKTINISDTKPQKDNAAIRYLWARKKIQLLDDYGSVGAIEESKVTALGLKYNLLTKYTSFIAIEEKVANDGSIETVKQPLPLPQNVSNNAIGFDLNVSSCWSTSKIDAFSLSKIPSKPEDITMVFYDHIEIISELSSTLEDTIKKQIEDQRMRELDICLIEDFSFQDISIFVGKDGKVSAIQFDVESIDAELKKCIEDNIFLWDFSSYTLSDGMEIKIHF